MITCIYCNSEVPDESDYVPLVNNDKEWNRLSNLHAKGCEWIDARAFRLEDDGHGNFEYISYVGEK